VTARLAETTVMSTTINCHGFLLMRAGQRRPPSGGKGRGVAVRSATSYLPPEGASAMGPPLYHEIGLIIELHH
jgi:hypothetical protein